MHDNARAPSSQEIQYSFSILLIYSQVVDANFYCYHLFIIFQTKNNGNC